MKLEELRQQVCKANLELKQRELIIYSWGNVSGIDRNSATVIIKPSGISYDELTPEKLVAIDLEGNTVEGDLKPSSDTPTHLELYRNFEDIGGICHTHSTYATMWAQSEKQIECFGTTHADYFYGPVPVTDKMTEQQIKNDYELNTGKVIIKKFREKDLQPMQMKAALVSGHGPFTWGKDAEQAVESAVVLEQIALMAFGTLAINANQKQIDQFLLDKHYLRKHGKNAYYGQK